MIDTQSTVAGVIISFATHAAALKASRSAHGASDYLTPLDRIEVIRWEETASRAGFDRMVIHDRDVGDAVEVGNFLCVYGNGESWSRLGFARHGASIQVWCCVTCADIGVFSSLAEAFRVVLLGMPADEKSPRQEDDGAVPTTGRPIMPSAIVTQFRPGRH